MVAEITEPKLYIVISQTGTILSRLLKMITKAEYNHVSIALNKDLEYMYSFGRKNAYFPFWGGFVIESKNFGTFKRFSDTDVQIMCLDINSKQYSEINNKIKYMISNKKRFKYNYLGLFFSCFKIYIKREKYLYCSEFVKQILLDYNIGGSAYLEEIEVPKPIDFLKLENLETIYIGKLKDYT